MNAMVVLVTGANGQLGQELQRRSKMRGVAVAALPRSDLDIADAAAVSAAISRHRPAIVVNAAAFTAVDRAERETAQAFAINRDGPANLARSCAAAGAALIHVSTDYVFGGEGDRPWLEDDEPRPINVYGRTKLAGETAICELLDRRLILRTSCVFGATGANFVDTMLRLASRRDELTVVDDQIAGPTPAGALAEAILALCRILEDGGDAPWGLYHFAGAPWVSRKALAEAAFQAAVRLKILDHAPRVTATTTAAFPSPARRPLNTRLDCTRWRQTFAYPPPDWSTWLDDVLVQRTSEPAP
jgi:dTDP-4-dehydrorhamnose reductase